MVSMVSIVTIKIIGYDWDEQVGGFDLVLVQLFVQTPRVAPSCPCGMQKKLQGAGHEVSRCHLPNVRI